MLAIPDFKERAGRLQAEAQVAQVIPHQRDRFIASDRNKRPLILDAVTYHGYRGVNAESARLRPFFAFARRVCEIALQHLLQAGGEPLFGEA